MNALLDRIDELEDALRKALDMMEGEEPHAALCPLRMLLDEKEHCDYCGREEETLPAQPVEPARDYYFWEKGDQERTVSACSKNCDLPIGHDGEHKKIWRDEG